MPARPKKKAPKRPDSLLHRDIKELEIGKKLRRLGGIRVTEWEFSDVFPAVNRIAQKEVDLGDILRRTANYRVTEWDLADLLGRRERLVAAAMGPPSPEEMRKLSDELSGFVRFVTGKLIDRPDDVGIKISHTVPGALMIKLVLVRRDAAALIGHGGHTAAAIRNIIKDVGRKHHVRVNLRILSKEEDGMEIHAPT